MNWFLSVNLVHHLFRPMILFTMLVSQLAWISVPDQDFVVRMGVYENPPLISYSEGKAQGFVIDLIDAIAFEEGWQVAYMPCNWARCLEMLDAREIDILGPIAYSDERAERFIFNQQTFFTNWGVIYAQDNNNIETFVDLDGKTLAVLREDIYTDALADLLTRFDIQPEYLQLDDYSTVLAAVESGDAQAGLVNRLYGGLHASTYNVFETPIIFYPVEIRFAAPMNAKTFILEPIDRYLRDWKNRDGSPYNQALERWLIASNSWQMPAWMRWVPGVLAGGVGLFLLTSLFLRWQVKRRTSELQNSEDRNRALLESIPDLMFQMNREGVFLDYQASKDRELHAPPEQFLGKNVSEVMPPDIAETTLHYVHRALENNEIYTSEYQLPKNGETRDFEARYIPNSAGEVLTIIRDITDRKHAEKALDESHASLLIILDSLEADVYVSDLETYEILFMNQHMRASFNGNMVGHSCWQMFRGETGPCHHCTNSQLVDADGEPTGVVTWEGQNPITRRWYINNDRAITWVDGRLVRLQIATDVTKLKRTETALRESEERYRLVSDLTSDYAYAYSVDDDGNLVNEWVTGAFDRITGYTKDGLQSLGGWEKLIYEQDFHLPIAQLKALLKGEEKTVEYRIKTKNGQIRWMLDYAKPVWDDKIGRTTFIYGAVQDVTRRRQAEEALRESESRYRTLFEHANDAIFLERDNDEIIDVNHQACELMGYTREDLLQMTVPELQAPEVRGKKGSVIKQELEKYRGELFESLNLHRDGRKIPVEVSTASLPGQGPGLVLAIIRDITERKRIEVEIRDNANRMEVLLEIEKAITSTLDLEEVLEIIMTEMEKVIPYNSISLQILQNKLLKILACRGFGQPKDVMELSFPLDPKYPNYHVIKTRAPLAIEDVIREYPHFQSQSNLYKSGHIRSWLGVPLISKGKVNGMIALDRSETNPFSEAEIQLATAIASQAALAIENASLFSEAQLRLERLSSLRRIDQTISSSMDLRMTLGVLLGQVLHQLEVDAAAVLLYRTELQSLQFIAGQGFRTQALQFTDLRLGQGFAGRAALEQRTIRVNNLATTQTGFLHSPEFRAEGFVTYIGVPLIAKGTITGVMEIYHRQPLEPNSEWMVFLETLAGQAAIAIDNIRLFEDLQSSNLQLRQAYDATIEGWAKALELRDMETKGHSHRAVELTLALARKLGIADKKLTHIRWGVLLHDIGKMGVPDAILQKTGHLTEKEWEIMREHPLYAYKWLVPISYLRPALDIPYCHHEKWDGTGYPKGLEKEHIPLSARIFAVVDVWDALLSDRPYRKAWTREKALAYLREQSGQHFDPRVVEAFIELLLEEGHLT